MSIAKHIRKIANELVLDPITQLMYKNEPQQLSVLANLQKRYPNATVIGSVRGLPVFLTGASDIAMEGGLHSEFNNYNHEQASKIIKLRIKTIKDLIAEEKGQPSADLKIELTTLESQLYAHQTKAGIVVPKAASL